MKIEHLTLGGNSMTRDTDDILDPTRRIFDVIGWKYESQVIHLPKLPFQIKITAAEEGAIFDIQKSGSPVVMNVCSFWPEHSDAMLLNVTMVSDEFRHAGIPFKVRHPRNVLWLYSVVVNPMALSAEDTMIAGEVELYIYDQLHRAASATR